MPTTKAFNLPYAEILPDLLASIFAALQKLAEAEDDGRNLDDEEINKLFHWLRARDRKFDAHLSSSRYGKNLRSKKVPANPTRVSSVIKLEFQKASSLSDEGTTGSGDGSCFLPSPLRIALQILTVPDEPVTSAYAFVTLRAYLLASLHVRLHEHAGPTEYTVLTYQAVRDALSSMERYRIDRDNVPPESVAKLVVGHLLAMKGTLHLRFGTTRVRQQSDGRAGRLAFCNAQSLDPNECFFEFRRDRAVEKFPDTAELSNEIWGVPLALRGADTVFFGGLKYASDGALVAKVSGKPGSGKTSLALGIVASLIPLGARAYYVTAEEEPSDLLARLWTLVPESVRRLSVFPRKIEEWFRARRLSPYQKDGAPNYTPDNYLRSLLNEIHSAVQIGASELDPAMQPPSTTCSLVVVLDGIQVYFDSSREPHTAYPLERFVQDCRLLGALVVITAAAAQAKLEPLDYLVDIVVELDHLDAESPDLKPVRVLKLKKTRHQVSRPGTHVFHLSEGQVRIAPQVPSQLGERTQSRFLLPDQERKLDVLNRAYAKELIRADRILPSPEKSHYLDVFPWSHVLLHGRGSAGKAGLALKLLMAPSLPRDGRAPSSPQAVLRTLVVTFLYPESYYIDLWNKLATVLRGEYEQMELNREIPQRQLEVLPFVPGFLNPEDFVARIVRRLDRANLEGEPFGGVLLDGLHNVFLQFPRLQDRPLVWPMLYRIFRTRPVTVVSTHTTFSLLEDDGHHELVLPRAQPLLNALVQASDFYFELTEVEPTTDPTRKRGVHPSEIEYRIDVRSAIGQPRPANQLFWHRERLVTLLSNQRSLPFP